MRLLSYNILNGGGDRLPQIAGVIAAHHPDVVVLVEADDPGAVDTLAQRLNMTAVHGPSGGKHAGAILSRWPLSHPVNHALDGTGHWMNAFLEARVTTPDGTVWPIVALHFAAHASEERERLREQQLDSLFKRLAPLRNLPHLLAGDFNSNAPTQRIDPARCSPRTQRDWTENGGHLPRRIVQQLLDAGYLDTLHHTDPGLADTTGTYTTTRPGQRIDYVFTRGVDPARIRSAWIDQSPAARRASDHFPIGVDLPA